VFWIKEAKNAAHKILFFFFCVCVEKSDRLYDWEFTFIVFERVGEGWTGGENGRGRGKCINIDPPPPPPMTTVKVLPLIYTVLYIKTNKFGILYTTLCDVIKKNYSYPPYYKPPFIYEKNFILFYNIYYFIFP